MKVWQLSLRNAPHVLLCLLSLTTIAQTSGVKSWAEARTSHQAVLPVYWFESRPFIYENANGQLTGIEHDLIQSFAGYVKKNYNVDLTIKWIEATGFQNVFDRVQKSKTPCLGASAFSITRERKEKVNFSPPYMPDIMVMISNKNVPMAESAEDFLKTFSRLTAITIEGTTYERDLKSLKQNLELGFNLEYIPSARNILMAVSEQPNSFGFIDLPIYMMYFSENPSVNVRRQNYYPVKREGYGLLLPKNSNWLEPVNAFFTQPEFQAELESIMPRHLDIQLYKFVEELSLKSNSNIELLNKEREIQSRNLQEKTAQIEKQTRANYFLTALVVTSTSFLIAIVLLYRIRKAQNKQIESQKENITFKNKQLEQRNAELVTLNEEKNNFIKILAHDMRSPLNQIQGLSQLLLMGNAHLANDQKQLIENIQDGSLRLSKMISNILDVDAIEGNRVNLLTESTRITPLVEKIVESFKKVASHKKITLEFHFDRADRKIMIDTLYLTQILENLISNAIKFSPPNKRIDVSIVGVSQKVRISVKDEGPGLTELDQANLFKKFQRLSNRPTNGEPSIGLGLAIVKRYTEMMGGRVWCESESGMGAAFNVEFDEIQ